MIGKKTFLAAIAVVATMGSVAPVAQAAPNGTVTLSHADRSTVTVPWRAGPNGSWYAVDPLNKNKSNGVENAAVVMRPPSTSGSAPCFQGEVCIYQDANWQGWAYAIGASGVDELGRSACPGCQSSHHPASNGTWNDQMTSWKNLSSRRFCWTFDSYGLGETHFMEAGWTVPQVTDHENDEASSVLLCG
ncbi:peptidase inhibitor family I36 protein [Kibdelosporangium lantanae]|uniref:Peptidase inhibitor family I36 protein n=1 Tax=Kibdelosporangium lantanae TaxID=1497396 RepID=A0ABW3M1J3_9PSEU